MTRAWIVLELAVIWPVAFALVLIGLVPLALGFGLAFVASHIEHRIRARYDRPARDAATYIRQRATERPGNGRRAA